MTCALVALWAASALRVALADATFYEASLQTEARAANDPAGAGVMRAFEADPALRLSWLDRNVTLAGAYDPRLYVQDRADGVQALHRASVNATWALASRWQAVANAEAMYGMNDFLFKAPAPAGPAAGGGQAPAAPLQPLEAMPDATTLKYVSGDASFGLDGPIGATLRGGARVSALLSGGGDSAARTQLPLQRGGRLEGNLGWPMSPSDSLASTLTLAVSHFETGLVDVLAELKETWHHTLRLRRELRLGAGMAVAAVRGAGQTSSTLLPTAEAAISGRLASNVQGELGVRLTAMIDRVTGSIYDRADGTVLLRWRPAPSWTLGGVATGGVVAQGEQAGEKVASADLRIAWSPGDNWEVACGVRAAPQTPKGFRKIADTSQTSVYFTTTVRAGDRL